MSKKIHNFEEKHPFDEDITSEDSFYSQSYSLDSEDLHKEKREAPRVSSNITHYSLNYLKKNNFYIYSYIRQKEREIQELLE